MSLYSVSFTLHTKTIFLPPSFILILISCSIYLHSCIPSPLIFLSIPLPAPHSPSFSHSFCHTHTLSLTCSSTPILTPSKAKQEPPPRPKKVPPFIHSSVPPCNYFYWWCQLCSFSFSVSPFLLPSSSPLIHIPRRTYHNHSLYFETHTSSSSHTTLDSNVGNRSSH